MPPPPTDPRSSPPCAPPATAPATTNPASFPCHPQSKPSPSLALLKMFERQGRLPQSNQSKRPRHHCFRFHAIKNGATTAHNPENAATIVPYQCSLAPLEFIATVNANADSP